MKFAGVKLAGWLLIALAATGGGRLLSEPVFSFRRAPDVPLVFDPSALALIDLNRTGSLEILGGGRLSTNVDILYPQGDGTYERVSHKTGGSSPHGMGIADFNRDGLGDLAIANNETGDLSVFMGREDGAFPRPVLLRVFKGFDSHGPIQLALSDLNEDGLTDIAVAVNTSSEFVIFRGKGDGTFEKPYSVPTGQSPHGIVVGDFFGHGRMDVALPCFRTKSVFLHENLGDGVYGPPVVVKTGFQPRMIVAADFNRDGRCDLAVTNHGESTVSVLENLGGGKFKSKVVGATLGSLYGIDAGDLDNDGYPDLVAADPTTDKMLVLMHFGRDFDFLNTETIPPLPDIQTVAVGDLNNDGANDIVAGLQQEKTVAIFYGTSRAKNPPLLDRAEPKAAAPGEMVTIYGRSLGVYQHQCRIYFNGVDAGWADAWSDNMLKVRVPDGATDGPITVSSTRGMSSELPFKVGMLGDVTLDGAADVRDAVALMRLIAGGAAPDAETLALGDVSPAPQYPGGAHGDRVIDENDALALLRRALGLVSLD